MKEQMKRLIFGISMHVNIYVNVPKIDFFSFSMLDT